MPKKRSWDEQIALELTEAEAITTTAPRKLLHLKMKRQFAKRSLFLKIDLGWNISASLATFMAALSFFAWRGMMLP